MPGEIISTRNMLERLVAFDTTSRESNLALIGFVQDYLDGHGIASTLIYNDAGTKANLYATIGPCDADEVLAEFSVDAAESAVN